MNKQKALKNLIRRGDFDYYTEEGRLHLTPHLNSIGHDNSPALNEDVDAFATMVQEIAGVKPVIAYDTPRMYTQSLGDFAYETLSGEEHKTEWFDDPSFNFTGDAAKHVMKALFLETLHLGIGHVFLVGEDAMEVRLTVRFTEYAHYQALSFTRAISEEAADCKVYKSHLSSDERTAEGMGKKKAASDAGRLEAVSEQLGTAVMRLKRQFSPFDSNSIEITGSPGSVGAFLESYGLPPVEQLNTLASAGKNRS